MKWTNKGHEFDEVGEKLIKDDTKYYLWGAGLRGKFFFDEFKEHINIIGILDSDPNKFGTEFCGIEVQDVQKVLNESIGDTKVIGTSVHKREMSVLLNEYGFIEYSDFFFWEEFSMLYYMFKEKKLHLPMIGRVITEKCTLKCKNCIDYIPCIDNPIHCPMKTIIEDIESVMQWTDSVHLFIFSGGDALLHPNICEIIESIGKKYYKKKIYNFEVQTNATFMLNDEQINTFKKYNVIIRFTNYGEILHHKQRINDMKQMLDIHDIRYNCVNIRNWLNLGYPQQTNGIENENLQWHFDNCNVSCRIVDNKNLYFCGHAQAADRIQYTQAIKSDSYDLSVFENDKKKELMEYFIGFSENGYFEHCKKCNGLYGVNKQQIIAGEQL